MARNRINEILLFSRALVQCLWHIFIPICDTWHVPVTYRSASCSRMRCPQKVCKHSDVPYSICINKCTLLTGSKFPVLFIYNQSLVYLFVLFVYILILTILAQVPRVFSFLGGGELPEISTKHFASSDGLTVSKIRFRGDSFMLCFMSRKNFFKGPINTLRAQQLFINLLAPELFFLILAHPVYKMWIIQEPNNLELWNKLHFEEEKKENICHV